MQVSKQCQICSNVKHILKLKSDISMGEHLTTPISYFVCMLLLK